VYLRTSLSASSDTIASFKWIWNCLYLYLVTPLHFPLSVSENNSIRILWHHCILQHCKALFCGITCFCHGFDTVCVIIERGQLQLFPAVAQHAMEMRLFLGQLLCLYVGLARTARTGDLYGVYLVFMAGNPPNIRWYTVYIYSSGQP